MVQKGRTRLLLALVLSAVLALAQTSPASAAGWPVWRLEGMEAFAGFFAHLFDRLEPEESHPGVVLKCGDQGSSIDPNGCTKAQSGSERSQVQRRLRGTGSKEVS